MNLHQVYPKFNLIFNTINQVKSISIVNNNTLIANIQYIESDADLPIGYNLRKKNMKNYNVINISSLFVEENYRNQGLATFLLQTVIQLAKAEGYKYITLDNMSDNAKSISNIYTRHGFQYINPTEFESSKKIKLSGPEMYLIL
jgi:GNAT superfamily N-acetyltransferase